MSGYFKNYGLYLRQAAVGLLKSPVSPILWEGFGMALREVAATLLMLAMCLVGIALYPITVPFVALLQCESDKRSAARKQAWANQMNSNNWRKGDTR
ncbi:hypothetical protein [Burkholderia gladioli]|uniref:hypothetical protein n=1 Tax=Burkholderia gladioli TaxID=28095 RepID=UPI00163FDCD0|nr:hypothetical protein [Burkholderia gladioli]